MATNEFENRSVVVTGGASGIGLATVRAFAAQGANVLIADLNEEAARSLTAELGTAGVKTVVVIGDLSDQTVVDEVVTTAMTSFGGIDVLVNNAGIADSMSAVADVTDAEWDRLLRINLTAPFRLTRAALPHMLAAGHGAIVFTASEASLRGSAAGAAYTTSKHAIAGLVKSLAITYRDKGIRTNAIAPGGTATNIEVNAAPGALGPTAIGNYLSNVGRVAAADEQAAAILFLASAAASNISGVILPVDNGWSAV